MRKPLCACEIMDEEGSFIFYEADYLQTSFSAFQDMRAKGEHTDLILKTRDRQFSVHRVVLAARVPHFRKVLASHDREISLNEMDSDVLNAIINFAYEGKLKVTIENMQAMLFAAVCLELCKVKKACLDFQAKRFNSDKELKRINIIPSDVSIRSNFEKFCNSQEFLLLPYYALKELIGRDDLKVANEEKVFEALIKWIKASPTERQHHLPYLLPEIRMNYLSPEYLIDRVATEILVTTSARAKQIVEDVKSYHLLKKRSIFLSFNSSARLYRDAWHAQHSISCDPSKILATNQSDLMSNDTSNFIPSNTLATNQSDLNPSDGGSNISSNSILTPSQSDLISNDTSNFIPSNILAPDQSDLNPSDGGGKISSNSIPTPSQSDLMSNDTSNFIPSNTLAINQSDLTSSNGGSNISSNSILTPSQSDLMSANASSFPTSNTIAANQSDLIFSDHSSVSPSNTVANNQNNPMSNGASNLPMIPSSLSNESDCNTFKFGVYTVRSFSSTGTFVSYYDHRNRKWDDFSSISLNDLVLHVVYVAQKLYVFFPQSVETFHVVTHEWSTVGLLSVSTEGSGVVSQGNRIYIFGGVHDPDKVRCFDTQENKWLQNEAMQVACHSMSVVSSPDKFVLHTGGSRASCFNRFSIFHTTTKKWTEMPSMITRRMNHDSAVSRGKFYVCGGRNDGVQFLDTVEVYDTASQKWSFVSRTKISRCFHSLVSWKKKLYIFGGKTERDVCSCSVEIYDPETDRWVYGLPLDPLVFRTVSGMHNLSRSEEAYPMTMKAVVVAPTK